MALNAGIFLGFTFSSPQGTVGCLTSIALCYFGVQMGYVLLVHKSPRARLVRLCAWGFPMALLGAALCGFSRDDGVIPINKACE